MYTYVVKEYYQTQYVNGYVKDSPREYESKVNAKSAIEAIRQVKRWKNASSFTHRGCNTDWNRDKKTQAHTQNFNGTAGCEAIRKEA